jgi:hypothetical protein
LDDGALETMTKRARKNHHVTLKFRREFRATIDVCARTQAEAEQIALREYDRFVRAVSRLMRRATTT